MKSLNSILVSIALTVASYAVFGQYVYEGDKFSVVFPGEPSMWSEVYEDSDQPFTIDFYLFEEQDGKTFYMLSTTDYNIANLQSLSEYEIDNILYTAVSTFLESIEMEPTFFEEITLNENLGLLFSGKSHNDYCQGKVYLVKNRIYQIVSLTAERNVNKEIIDQFLLSFKLK